MSKQKIIIGLGLAALSTLLVLGTTDRGESQPAGVPRTITLAIYAPTAPFASSSDRLKYVQSLAQAISQNTGVQVRASSYTSMGQLNRANPDFAIVDGQCYAASNKGTLLATAKIGGSTSRSWALYSSQGPRLQGLQGKRLAYVKTGCNDTGFMAHAMLESEVSSRYFSGRVGKPDIQGAVAEVVSRKGAQGVFAPAGMQKGLTKVFDAGSVPNPAFLWMDKKLPKSFASKVGQAVRSYGGGGAISGWDGANQGIYNALRGRMRPRVKRPLFANPSPVRVDVRDVLVPPKTLNDWETTPVDQHFEAPPERLE